jgi:hypothetical protein
VPDRLRSRPPSAIDMTTRISSGLGASVTETVIVSPDNSVAWWQDCLTPLWRRCSGGCHLNRKTDDLLRSAGFTLTHLATGYASGPRPMAFMYEGQAEL